MIVILYLIKCLAIGYVVTYINDKFKASPEFQKEFEVKETSSNKMLWALSCVPVIGLVLLLLYGAKYIDAKMSSKL